MKKVFPNISHFSNYNMLNSTSISPSVLEYKKSKLIMEYYILKGVFYVFLLVK